MNENQEFNCSWFEEKDLFFKKRLDYTIVSNFDLTEFEHFFPEEIKKLLNKNWYYHLHVPPLRLHRQHLRKKVDCGGILAYCFVDLLSIGFNDCIYFGFLPTKSQKFEDSFKEIVENGDSSNTHSDDEKNECLVSMQKVWPRNISIHIKRVGKCICDNNGCVCIEYLDRTLKSQRNCIRVLNFTDMYIIMGSLNQQCGEGFKEPRICSVCAKCYKCSKSTTYCKTHAKKCKHKLIAIDEGKMKDLFISEFQKCKPC